MKKCPQCEFIYEDDQSLCDMDGVLLVYDSRTLPLTALATVPPQAQKAQRLNRAVPAFATVILALVLGMVYYVSTRPKTYTVPAAATAPAPIPAQPVQAAAAEPTPVPVEVSSPEETAKETVKEETKPAPSKSLTTAPAPAKKTTTKAAVNAQTKPPTTEKKDESKVGSILKKTGRILKKPFKF
jgi:hypothetical protein